MAKAADARRAAELKRVDAALKRLDEGEYGDCVRCGEEISERRLELDPATPFCAGCAR
jgi:DnaK suppressor protein